MKTYQFQIISLEQGKSYYRNEAGDWSYHYDFYDFEGMEEKLNELGKCGWKLVSTVLNSEKKRIEHYLQLELEIE